MKNENDIKPNLLQLESLRSELIEKTLNTNSNFLRLFLYQNYFGKTLSLNNPNLEEAFLKEFLDDYVAAITKYEVWGIKPELTNKIILQIKSLLTLDVAIDEIQTLNSEIDRIAKQSEKLKYILEGKEYEDDIEHKAFFPLIDKEAPDDFYGIIESVTIKINKAADNDKFIIVPSEKEIENKISEQCKKSWLLAVDILKKHIKKPYKYHEVVISFDKKEGFYEGNSLGIALTLSFLKELLKFYNPTYVIKIKEHSAFTGGVDEKGTVLETSGVIIKRKVTAIFFSEVNTFVVPKLEETYAYFALTQLKNQYPKRNLKLIPAIDIYDVLNRRDLVEIKKINPVIRSAKFARKNLVPLSVILFLTSIISFFILRDIDTNPHSFTADGTFLHIKNKNGKVLWEKKVSASKTQIEDLVRLKGYIKIVDIDSDGRNELLIVNEKWGSEKPDPEFNRISCYDFKGETIWRYSFKDQVSSKREVIPPFYAITIIDTVTISDEKNLFVFANNSPSFSSAIFRIGLKTGKRLPGTFWCSGHISDGIIKDINYDGKKDILCVGLDNGYEDAVFFGINVDTTIRVRPTTNKYLISGFPVSELVTYIRFPKTDYDIYKNYRTPGIAAESFKDDFSGKYYQFYTMDYLNENCSTLWYQIDYNLKDVNIVVDNRFRVMRDSLVAHDRLPLPYTDTPEYVELQKSKILYRFNGKWVKRRELE